MRRRVLIVLGLTVSAGIIAWSWWARTASLPEIPAHEDPAVREALERARQGVANEPRSAKAWGQFGMVLMANNLVDAAGPALEQAEKLDARDYLWPYLQAHVLRRSEPTRAWQKALQAKALAPRRIHVQLLVGELGLGLGEHADAKASFEAVLQLEPDHPQARIGLIRCQVVDGKLDEGRAALSTLVEDRRVAKQARLLLAEILDRTGQPVLARSQLRQAQALPNDPPFDDPAMHDVQRHKTGLGAILDSIRAWTAADRLNEAVLAADKATKEYPKSARAQFLRGLAYAQRSKRRVEAQGRKDDAAAAEAAFRATLALEPDNAQAMFFLGLLHADLQLPHHSSATALEHFRAALAADPRHVQAALQLARGLSLQKKWEEVAAIAREQLKFHPGHVGLHALLAETFEDQGRPDAALSHWLETTRLEPDNRLWQTRLALCLWKLTPLR